MLTRTPWCPNNHPDFESSGFMGHNYIGDKPACSQHKGADIEVSE